MPRIKKAATVAAQWIIFFLGWLIVLGFRVCGRIQEVGLKEAIANVRKGRMVIAANHPSLLEPFVLGGILFPAFAFNMRKCPWSVPDKNFYPPSLHWFTVSALKHIPLDRGNGTSAIMVLKTIVRRLRQKDSIILHPEGGRTCKGVRFIEKDGRRMRALSSNVASCTIVGRGEILPVWIDFYDKTPESFFAGLIRMTFSRRMIVRFGKLHTPNRDHNKRQRNDSLAEAILSA